MSLFLLQNGTFSAFSPFFIVVYQQNGSLQLSVVPTALNVKNNAKYSTQWFSRLEKGHFLVCKSVVEAARGFGVILFPK